MDFCYYVSRKWGFVFCLRAKSVGSFDFKNTFFLLGVEYQTDD